MKIIKFNSLASSVAISALVLASNAYATDFTSATNGTTFNNAGKVSTINQIADYTDINWKNMDVARGNSLIFNQPNAAAVAVNHVTGGTPTVLAGLVKANGRIVILNDAGLLITNTGQLNVGSLLATTAKDFRIENNSTSLANNGGGNITNDGSVTAKGAVILVANDITNNGSISGDSVLATTANNAGIDDEWINLANYSGGAITNNGKITAANGKAAMLYGNNINNAGSITANKGDIVLKSAKSNAIRFSDGKFVYDVTEANTSLANSQVTNTGTLTAKSGRVEITTKQLQDLRTGAINLRGVVDASSFDVNSAGGTVLVNSSGNLNSAGVINASSARAVGVAPLISTSAYGTNNFSGTYKANYGEASIQGKDIAINGDITADRVNFSNDSNLTITNTKANGQYGVNEIGENKLAKKGHLYAKFRQHHY